MGPQDRGHGSRPGHRGKHDDLYCKGTGGLTRLPSQGQSNAQSTGSGSAAQGTGKHGKPIQLPEGEPEPTATPAEEARATVADIALTSPAQGPAAPCPPPTPAMARAPGPRCSGRASLPIPRN